MINKLRITRLPNLDSVGGFLKSMAVNTLSGGGLFELQINPEQYSRHFSVKFEHPKEQGSKRVESQFNYIDYEKLDLKFTIDGTGVVGDGLGFTTDAVNLASAGIGAIGNALGADIPANVAFVSTKLLQLQQTVYGIIDETHRPPFILVNWGKLTFVGELENMTHAFTLFHSSGLPLRVEVTLQIMERRTKAGLDAALSLLSPDLTRKRQVKSSDNILTLCEEVYEKPDYYLEVAKANNLSNFRRIEAGKELLFPPVAK
jgi:hypothetical protein